MSEVTIVGAGLAGLTAAINLARSGHSVTVLEREARIGGMPEFRPDPAGSPLDLESVRHYTGIDIAPAVKRIDEARVYAYGERFDMPMQGPVEMYMVERGSRSTAIDTMLLDEATALGVEVEFDRPVATQGDFALLPPDTIVATGLQMESFEALSIPYSPLYGYFAKGTASHERTTVSIWMDSFTRDYAFNCTVNGVAFALLFQRDLPLRNEDKERYRAMAEELDGVELAGWSDLLGGACPVGSLKNPRLFHGNKILAGTLAGVMDPFLFFGMLGALASGRIAAVAVEDKGRAWDDFRRAVRTYYPAYINKRIWNIVPNAVRKPIIRLGLAMTPAMGPLAGTVFARNIPGWRLLESRLRGADGAQVG